MPKVKIIVIAKVEEEMQDAEDFSTFIKRTREKYKEITGDNGVLLRAV